MKSRTVIYVRWKLTGRIEHFTNLGKLYDKYKNDELGVSRHTLNKRDLYSMFQNESVEILKSVIF